MVRVMYWSLWRNSFVRELALAVIATEIALALVHRFVEDEAVSVTCASWYLVIVIAELAVKLTLELPFVAVAVKLTPVT